MSNLLVTFTNGDTHKHGGQLWLSQKFESAWRVLEEIECILRRTGQADIDRTGAQAVTAIYLAQHWGYKAFLNDREVCAALVANDETYSILEFEGDEQGDGYNVRIKLHAEASSLLPKCFQLDEYDEWGDALTYMQQMKDEITGGVV